MSHTRPVGKALAGICLLLAVVAVLNGCHQPPPLTPPQVSLPECPQSGMWSPFFTALYGSLPPNRTNPPTPGATIGMPGQLSLPGLQTDVPEFNDCQKFVALEGGRARFISLFAIFARARLDSLGLDSLALSAGGIVPVGEVYAFDSSYAPLGIRPGFNCLELYLAAGSGLSAAMIPVGLDEAKCLTPQPVNAGKVLAVTKLYAKNVGVAADYPPVARWDWDAKDSTQYIGIQCALAWCEIHDPNTGFESSKSYSGEPTAPAAVRRVVEVKGWYDEQRLALPSGSAPLVGDFTATFIPDPHLGDDHGAPDTSRYNGQWVTVATAAVNGDPKVYKKKLNLIPGGIPTLGPPSKRPPAPASTVYLCYSGTAATNPCFGSGLVPPSCKGGVAATWWARIQAVDGSKAYYCVIRREHPGVVIPGIVRWRWTVNDDTMWIRCLDGCCEVEAIT